MKKFCAILIAICVLACTAAGCSNKPVAPVDIVASGKPAGTGPAVTATPGQAVDTVDYSKIKVGILIGTTADDSGPGQALYASVQKVKVKYHLADDQIVWAENVYEGTDDVDLAIEQMVSQGCNLIIGHSSGYADQLATAAAKYPGVYFTGLECPVEADRFVMYSIDDQEALFLCGYIAARMSDDNKLGYVGCMPTVSGIRAVNAFARGAKYANTNAKVSVVWVNDWADSAAEKEAAKTLINTGVTSLGYFGSTSAVMQICAQYNVFSTGMYIDMHDYAPSSVLTSYLPEWSPILETLLSRAAKLEWDSEPIMYGLSDGAAGLAPLNTNIIPSDIAADFEAVRAKLAAGDIEVFAGPLYDNGGSLIAQEGEVLSVEDLLYMDFLVDNVVGGLQ